MQDLHICCIIYYDTSFIYYDVQHNVGLYYNIRYYYSMYVLVLIHIHKCEIYTILEETSFEPKIVGLCISSKIVGPPMFIAKYSVLYSIIL